MPQPMTPERWQQVSRIYHDALACEPHARDSFVLAACGNDEGLRREVASLLEQPSSDGFLALSPSPPATLAGCGWGRISSRS